MSADSVCAVIVTYNPGQALFQHISNTAPQVDRVVIVDNGSDPETVNRLLALEKNPKIKTIFNYANLGIAAALNLGIKHALGMGSDWICTLDQDSVLGTGYICEMLETFGQTARPNEVALVTPRYIDHASGVRVRLMKSGSGEILTTMTSGTMVPANAIRNLGPFDESLFIDAVDTEFCLRARRKGMYILQSAAVLRHSLGRTTYHSLLGLHFGTTNHSAGRRYYIMRNRMRLFARYIADWPWFWREAKTMLFDATKIALLEDDKWRKFRAMLVGIVHALNRKGGKHYEL